MSPDIRMRRSRLWRLVVATAALGMIAYVASFFWLRYWYIPEGEFSNFPKPHVARPVYEVVYYPLRLLAANHWSPTPREPDVFVGKLSRVDSDTLEFDLDDRTLSIGFVCEPAVCAALDGLRPGEEIEATFGSALVPGRDQPINKLLEIRKCEANDARCSDANERQHAQWLEQVKEMEAADRDHRECFAAMEQTLRSDSRYLLPLKTEGDAGAKAASDRYNSLEAEQRTCTRNLLSAHQRAVFEACEKHGCGSNIGGGCWHIADPIQVGVTARTLQKCGI